MDIKYTLKGQEVFENIQEDNMLGILRYLTDKYRDEILTPVRERGERNLKKDIVDVAEYGLTDIQYKGEDGNWHDVSPEFIQRNISIFGI